MLAVGMFLDLKFNMNLLSKLWYSNKCVKYQIHLSFKNVIKFKFNNSFYFCQKRDANRGWLLKLKHGRKLCNIP